MLLLVVGYFSLLHGRSGCVFSAAGRVRSLSSSLWSLTHLTALHINDNNLSRLPPEISNLPHLAYLNLSSNKLRSLPAELGNMVSLRWSAFL